MDTAQGGRDAQMDISNILSSVNSKEEFMNFLNELRYDNEQRGEEWENKDINAFLEGVCSWVGDMEGYFRNMNMEIPENIDWKFIATLFYVGKIYE